MPGITPDAPCPHCGTVQNAGTLAQHVRLCLADPDVRRRVLLTLRDPDDPTRAVSAARYNARRSMFDAPGDATLSQRHGGTWAAVCAAYGLLTPLPYSAKRPKTEKPPRQVKPKRVACPHCGMESTPSAIARHAATCLADPANRARYRALLTDDGVTGVTNNEYDARAAERGAPAVTTLRRMTGMSAWDDVLACFDLLPAAAALRTCPNCGQTFKALGYAHHYAKCSGGSAARMATEETEQESALIAYEARILERDAQQAQCLYVGDDDPRKPNYKPPIILPAPGLYVNGKPCQRVMLR
jgi:hypothetical protein